MNPNMLHFQVVTTVDTMTVPLTEVFFPSVVVCNINQVVLQRDGTEHNDGCDCGVILAGAKIVLPRARYLRERDLHQADLL